MDSHWNVLFDGIKKVLFNHMANKDLSILSTLLTSKNLQNYFVLLKENRVKRKLLPTFN